MSKQVTTIRYEIAVSDGDKTLQYFDFIYQVIEEAIVKDGVNELRLLNLLQAYTSNRAYDQHTGGIGLVGAQLAAPQDTAEKPL